MISIKRTSKFSLFTKLFKYSFYICLSLVFICGCKSSKKATTTKKETTQTKEKAAKNSTPKKQVEKPIKPKKTEKKYATVNFCDLVNYTQQSVVIECTYSGTEEFWLISGSEICSPDLRTELVFPNGKSFPEKYSQEFEQVHQNYWNSYLKLKLLGWFEKTDPQSELSNSQFHVEEVLNLEYVKVGN